MKHLWKMVLALVAMAVALAPVSAQNTGCGGRIRPRPVKGEKIAFVSVDFKGNPWRIGLMNADGSGRTFLTDEKTSAFDPALSPDGKSIAFTSLDYAGDRTELVVMGLDGTQRKTLIGNKARAWFNSPSWSPDGKHLAFSLDTPTKSWRSRPEIMVIDADGKNDRILGVGMLPSWSPDGKKILYSLLDYPHPGNVALHVMDADGKNDKLLIADGFAGVFSPDGKKIAYVGSSREKQTQIYISNADGTGAEQLTHDDAVDFTPQWSANGKQVYFTQVPLKADPMTATIYVIDADGKNEKKLTDGKSVDALNTSGGVLLFLGMFTK